MRHYQFMPGGGCDPYNSLDTSARIVVAVLEYDLANKKTDEQIRRGMKLARKFALNKAFGEFVRGR